MKKYINLKKRLCAYLLSQLANKTNAKNPITSYSLSLTDSQNYIINKKYEKLADKIIEYYYRTNHLPYYIFKSAGFLLTMQIIISILKPDFSNLYTIFEDPKEEIEISLESELKNIAEFISNNVEQISKTYNEIPEEPRITIHQEEVQKIQEYNSYLEEYSNYFHLDSTKVIGLAQKLTYTYTKDFSVTLNEETIKKYNLENKLNTPEASSLIFTHFLYRNVIKGEKGELSFNVEDYGYERNSFQTTGEITIDSTFTKGEDVRLVTGETRAEYMGKICTLLDANQAGCLAISYTETGVDALKSPRLRLYNNPGGMRYKSGEFMEFPTLKAGIISHVLNLMSYPEKYKVDSKEKLWAIYSAEGEFWIINFNNFYNDILSNPEKYFGTVLEENSLKKGLTR